MKHFFKAVFGIFILLISCDDITVDDPVDPNVQRAVDIELIDSYLYENGIDDYDTTESGARYFITQQGLGDPIVKDDIIKVNYIGKTLEGLIVYTNIQEVADTSVAVPTFGIFEPRVFTYSETGWSLNSVSFREGSLLMSGPGLNQAIGKGFKNLKLGGTLEVLLPSDQALAAQGTTFIDPYSVLLYEIYPIEKL